MRPGESDEEFAMRMAEGPWDRALRYTVRFFGFVWDRIGQWTCYTLAALMIFSTPERPTLPVGLLICALILRGQFFFIRYHRAMARLEDLRWRKLDEAVERIAGPPDPY